MAHERALSQPPRRQRAPRLRGGRSDRPAPAAEEPGTEAEVGARGAGPAPPPPRCWGSGGTSPEPLRWGAGPPGSPHSPAPPVPGPGPRAPRFRLSGAQRGPPLVWAQPGVWGPAPGAVRHRYMHATQVNPFNAHAPRDGSRYSPHLTGETGRAGVSLCTRGGGSALRRGGAEPRNQGVRQEGLWAFVTWGEGEGISPL